MSIDYGLMERANQIVAEWAGQGEERTIVQLAHDAMVEARSAATPRAEVGETSSDGPCRENDGCPTELAVLQRFWRSHQSLSNASRAEVGEAAPDICYIQVAENIGAHPGNDHKAYDFKCGSTVVIDTRDGALAGVEVLNARRITATKHATQVWPPSPSPALDAAKREFAEKACAVCGWDGSGDADEEAPPLWVMADALAAHALTTLDTPSGELLAKRNTLLRTLAEKYVNKRNADARKGS